MISSEQDFHVIKHTLLVSSMPIRNESEDVDHRAELICELREVDLKNRPDEMLEVSPKGPCPSSLLHNKKLLRKASK